MSTRVSDPGGPSGPVAAPAQRNLTISAAAPRFLDTLENWLRDRPELLVLIRYSAAAGCKDFEFYSSFEALPDRIRRLPPITAITAFRQNQLPLRGTVTEDFIAACMRHIPDGSEFLVLETVARAYGQRSWLWWDAGESHAELREALEHSRDLPVAVGLYPPFWLADSDDLISAVVPDEHGVVRGGIY
jgi:hypothetical protein